MEYTNGTKELASASNVNLTYSISDPKKLKDNKVTATVTDAGILKISRGEAGKAIDIDIVSEDGTHVPATITLVAPAPITKIEKFASPKQMLDLGYNEQRTLEITCPATTPALAATTDELIWSSSKPAIATVSASGEFGEKATITAVGVGTAKITVKASSGKNASFTVNVYATPDTVEITGADSGYTGKPITLNAVLKADDGKVLPVGNTSLKWAKANSKDKDIKKVSAKKDIATVTPADLLTDLNGVTSSVTVAATYKNNTGKGTTKMDPVSHPIRLTQSNVKNVTVDIFQRTKSDGKDHVYDIMHQIPVKAKSTAKNETVTFTHNGLKDLSKGKKAFYVGQNYFMDAKGEGQIDSIAWAVSGKNVNYNAYDEHFEATFTGTAKTTVKASYITVDTTGSKPKAIKSTKTINITPIQNATSIAFAKSVVVKNPAKNTAKPQSVSFSIKTVLPKRANYGTVEWKVLAYDGEKTYVQNTDGGEQKALIRKFNNKSVTIDVPGDFKAGSVIKVGAYTQAGVVAYGYIYITEQTTKVIPQASTDGGKTFTVAGTKKNVNTQSITLGSTDTLQLSAKLETQYYENNEKVVMRDPNARDAALGAKKLGDPIYGTTTAYQTEPVTYSLDKKSALIIKVDADGNVTPLKKGTATVTIKTLSNKSAKVTVIVD